MNGLDHDGTNTGRLDRVETEVGKIQIGMAQMQSDIRAVGVAVVEIKDAFRSWENREAHRADANRPNVVAIAAVLVTIISALVGGAWLISGQIARFDERNEWRNRETAQMLRQIDRLEQRQWQRKQYAPD